MKMTGEKVTQQQSRHFRSIARHVARYADEIASDMQTCQENTWTDLDRGFILGKLQDLEGNIKSMHKVLDDMLPDLWKE